ncbi:MAG: hypothetical protein RG741_01655 [Bacteroidales bacterium]|nr:hypothetical protein [Bacteroidales bacterium]
MADSDFIFMTAQRLILMSFFAVWLLLPAHAQSRQDIEDAGRRYLQFREYFESITPDSSVSEQGERRFAHVAYPERLPDWLFNAWPGHPDSVYVVAASDPGMEADAALELAMHRALIMNALTGSMQLANMREQFIAETGDALDNVYREFSRFSGRVYVSLNNISIVHAHTTAYDELIIMARMPATAPSEFSGQQPHWQLMAGLYSQAFSAGIRMQIDEQLNLELTPHDDMPGRRYVHQYAIINRMVNAQASLDDDLVSDLPAMNLRYARVSGGRSAEPDSARQQGYPMRNGIWHALLAGMLSALADGAHTGSIHFRQVGEVYDIMLRTLSSEMVTTTLRSSPPVLNLDNNRLTVEVSSVLIEE